MANTKYVFCLNDPINAFDPYGLFWSEFGKGFSEHIAEKAWETGKTPNVFEASAAGFAEVIKSWTDPNYDKEFTPWQPWPIENILEPYLEKEWLKDKGDFPDNDPHPCA